MNLPHLPLVVLDTETTGFVPRVHKIMEYASMGIENGKVVDTYEALFAAGEIPPVIQVLTRIKQADLEGKPGIEDRKTEVMSHIPENALLVGQNLAFDLGMLKGHGMDLSERPWIDTSLLAALVYPELFSYSLGYMSRVLNLDHSPQHRALGDVRATTELLSKIWERLLELPASQLAQAKEVMERAPKGYKDFFAALPKATKIDTPDWMKKRNRKEKTSTTETCEIPEAEKGKVTLFEEMLSPSCIEQLVQSAVKKKEPHWFAVKNLDSFLRRSGLTSESANHRVLWAPYQLLDQEAVKRLEELSELTAEEATLLVKMKWLSPRTRSDMPVHGGEEPVWNGRLACARSSKEYRDQYSNLPPVVISDHRELLSILTDEQHPGHALLTSGNVRVTVDDASMLEDTATKAYGWECNTEALRAASSGNAALTQLTDVLQLWMEKTRSSQDVRYLASSDLSNPEASGLRERFTEILATDLPEQTRNLIEHAAKILDVKNLANRITWIELWHNGTLVLSSVPEQVGLLLSRDLFEKAPTVLLVPQGFAGKLPEVLPPGGGANAKIIEAKKPADLPVSFDAKLTLETLMSTLPEGKTILLIPSKSMGENLYIRYAESLEAEGVTLICQGLSGGQGRMQAEFIAAKGKAVWILTPFSYEGIDLPEGTADRLIIKALPFDHPSHTVLSRRAVRYGNAFTEYLLPRLQHRLFRVLRAFCRMRKEGGGVLFLDERLEQKDYGRGLVSYLQKITGESSASTGHDSSAHPSAGATAKPKKLDTAFTKKTLSGAEKPAKPAVKKIPKKPKAEDQQLPLL